MRFYACQILLSVLPLIRGRSKSQHFDPALYANLHERGPYLSPAHNLVPDYYYDDVIAVNPIDTKPHEDVKKPNSNYQFSYGVADPEHGTSYSRSESADGKGGTKGQYQVHLPDGRIQTVKYVADENGYRADVSYEGEAVHDEAPQPNAISQNEAKPASRLHHHNQELVLQFPVDEEYEEGHPPHHQGLHRDLGSHVQYLEPAVNRARSFYPQIYHEAAGDEPVVVTSTPFFDGSHFPGPSPILSNYYDPNLERSFLVTNPSSFSPTVPRPPVLRHNSLHGNLTPSPHPIIRTPVTHGPISQSHPLHFPVSLPGREQNELRSILKPHPLIHSHARARTPFESPLFRTDAANSNRFTRGANADDSTSVPRH